MFGLIGACLAMYHTALPQNKTKIKAILIPAAVTSILAGVTEPIEFSFMFVAPILFVMHAVLNGLGMVVLNILGVRAIGPNGLIDFLLYNLPLGIAKTGWPMYVLVGLCQFVVYYIVFRMLITKLKLKTPGRETDGNTKLYTKKDLKEKNNINNKYSKEDSLSHVIVEGLGGKANIAKVDNCYTRLRITVKDPSKVNEVLLKNETSANGVVIKGENIQIVYGLKVNGVRKDLDEYLGIVANQ